MIPFPPTGLPEFRNGDISTAVSSQSVLVMNSVELALDPCLSLIVSEASYLCAKCLYAILQSRVQLIVVI